MRRSPTARAAGACKAIRPKARWSSPRASSASPEKSLARQRRVAEIPFTSERKRHTTVHVDPEKPAELRIMVKGAPEVLLSRCRYVMQQGQSILLTEPARADIAQRNDALASQALRVLAIATRSMPAVDVGHRSQDGPHRTSSCRKRSRKSWSSSAWLE